VKKRITDQPLLSFLDVNDASVAPVIPPAVVEVIEERQEQREQEERSDDAPIDAVAEPSPTEQPEAAESSWLGGVETEDVGDGQVSLFGDLEPRWKDLWRGMPEFEQRDLTPKQSLSVHFKDDAGRDAFAALIGQTITDRTRSLWYPKAEIASMVDKRFVVRGAPVVPMHPIYIVSKGRWESRLTSKSLHAMGVPHYIVVEAQELDQYAAAVDSTATLLVLDTTYQDEYDTCDDLGSTKGKGPGPARNFVWDHAIASGARWHWVMDDNIDGFYRLYQNLKTPCVTGAIFRCMEAFVDRYTNVGMAGPNYFMFASRKTIMPPLVLNTRIYSCNLIRNDLPYRWRARYNEDTDLSIRMLRAGLVTVQFNSFLQMKTTTQVLGGGNTAEFYAHEGTLPKSQMQVKLHPDISTLVEKWGRWHHHVDYSGFRSNKLIPRPDLVVRDEIDNFGMELERDANAVPI